MSESAGRRFHLNTVDNECKQDDYIEGNIAHVTLTQYDITKPNAKVAHALITESEGGTMYIMKLTAWREQADLFAHVVNATPNSKFRISNLDVTPVKEDFRMSSNVAWEATLKRPLTITMIERGTPISPTKVTGVTATLQQIKAGEAGPVTLQPGSILSTTARATSVELNEMGEKVKQVVTLEDGDTKVLLTCWPDNAGKPTFNETLLGKMLIVNNIKLSDFAKDQRGGYSLETVGRTHMAEVPPLSTGAAGPAPDMPPSPIAGALATDRKRESPSADQKKKKKHMPESE